MFGLITWSPGVTLEEVEKQVILLAYKHFNKNKTATAISLGISVKTIDNKFDRYEAQEKEQSEKDAKHRAARAEFLARCRGQAPSDPLTLAQVRMESSSSVPQKQSMSLSKPEEVQEMLPAQTPKSHSKRSSHSV